MIDDRLAFDRLLHESLEDGGPHRAPSTIVPLVLERTDRQPQRRAWVPALDRRMWPPRAGSLADPAIWRSARTAVALALVVALLAGLAAVGARLLTPEPVLRYTGELTPVATLSTTFAQQVIALDNARVMVLGGASAHNVLAEVVDLETGETTTITADDPMLHLGHAVRVGDGRVAAIAWRGLGLDDGSDEFGLIVIIDPDRRQAQVVATLPEGRRGAALAPLPGGRLLLVGGDRSSDGLSADGSAYVVDPASGDVTPTGSLAVPRADAILTVLGDGRVLVSGGQEWLPQVAGGWDVSSGRHESVLGLELYDPATGTFHLAGSLPAEPSALPALLKDGRVLIPGHRSRPAPTCLRSDRDAIDAYTFDPVTEVVHPAPKIAHAVTALAPLPDGTVVMTGTWMTRTPDTGDCVFSTREYVKDAWLGVMDPVTGATRLSLDPFTGESTLPADPDVSLGAVDVLPDGRAVFATWDVLGAVDPQPPTQILVFE